METSSDNLLKRDINEKEPQVGKRYWVQCDGFRTMAVMNKDGKWLTVFNEKELPDVICYYD
jgi:hypothetical protein